MKNYLTLGSQRGMTFLGISSLLIALVVGGKLLFATVPAYLEDRAITSLVEKKFQENPNATVEDLFAAVNRQLQIDQSDVSPEEIFTVASNAPGNLVLVKNYDIEAPLFAHVSVVNHFEGEIRQKP